MSDNDRIMMWTEGVQVEDVAMQQLRNTASLPFIYKHLAVMPDVHWGMGATVGSVMPTKGAIVPAAVGVDIGCGMIAVETSLNASQLPDSLSELRHDIERSVPHGRTNRGGPGDRGAWHTVPEFVTDLMPGLIQRYEDIIGKHPKVAHPGLTRQCGTLGGGNHFIEICLDENDIVWIMLHSGSRGAGNKIGTYFISLAKKEMERFFIHLPDKDLAYLAEGTQQFKDYCEAVKWAQEYAFLNRQIMVMSVLRSMRYRLPEFVTIAEAVNCHHNYVAWEHHFGQNVIVTRKGAVRAREGDLGIIPGSMGTRSYIVRGKGNRDSFMSCSHGAGRRMSRGQARKQFTLEDHVKATEGVECRKDNEVIDETPGAYKDIDVVMAAQRDLVEVVHTLKQVLCVKG